LALNILTILLCFYPGSFELYDDVDPGNLALYAGAKINNYTTEDALKTTFTCTLPPRIHGKQRRLTLSTTEVNCTKYFITINLLLAGDINTNPGPNYKFPCLVCQKPVKKNQKGIQCDECAVWTHTKCILMPDDEYQDHAEAGDLRSWFCWRCSIPQLTDSFFDKPEDTLSELSEAIDSDYSVYGNNDRSPDISDNNFSVLGNNETDSTVNTDIFTELREMRGKHRKNILLAHLNINSYRYKHIALEELLYDKVVDILIIGETKLDDSFPDRQFHVTDYKNVQGGSEPQRRRTFVLRQVRYPL